MWGESFSFRAGRDPNLEITCPNCGNTLPYVAELAGRELFCLGCGARFAVPRDGACHESSNLRLEKVQFPDASPATAEDVSKKAADVDQSKS